MDWARLQGPGTWGLKVPHLIAPQGRAPQESEAMKPRDLLEVELNLVYHFANEETEAPSRGMNASPVTAEVTVALGRVQKGKKCSGSMTSCS